jgi:hypothetical protein
MKRKIQTLREKLNFLIDGKPVDTEETLKLSMELDKLILEYYYSQMADKVAACSFAEA